MDSYISSNENLQNAKKESHVLPSGENFVLSSVLNSMIYEFQYKISNLNMTIVAQLYAVVIYSQLQPYNLHTRTRTCTLTTVSSNKRAKDEISTSANKIVSAPKCCLHTYDHRLPILAFCHLLRIFLTISPYL
jgi:hypothetical protein